jgi:hypothetical protein
MVERVRIAVMPEVVTEMRRHDQSVTAAQSDTVCTCADRVSRARLARLLDEPLSVEEAADLKRIESSRLGDIPAARLRGAVLRLCRLWRAFCVRERDLLRETGLREVERHVERDLERVFRHCRRRRWVGLGFEAARQYLKERPERAGALAGPLFRMTLLPAFGGAAEKADPPDRDLD